MQTQLICSDIDGTLLNKDRALSQKTISVIIEMAEYSFAEADLPVVDQLILNDTE